MPLEAGEAHFDLVPRLAADAAQDIERKVGGALKKAGAGLRNVGKQLSVAVTAPIVAGFASSVLNAQEVQSGLREVVTLTGLAGDAADEAFDEFQTGISDLSREIGVAQETLVGGLYQALSAGVPRDNAFEFLQVAGQAAIAGVTDTETAVDGLTTVINAFGLEADQVGEVSDSLFTAVKGGKTNFEELSGALFNVAPIAAKLGVPFQDVNAAIAAITAQGVPTSVATTQIRSALVSLIKPSEDLDKIFQGAGFEDAAAALRDDFAGSLNLVTEATGGSVSALKELVGSDEAVQGILSLTGDSADAFAAQLNAQAEAAGATATAFDEIDKSRSVERFKNTLTNLGITIGNVLIPVIDRVLAAVQPWIERFQNLSPTMQTVIVAALGLVAALGPLLGIIGTLVTVVGLLLSPIGLVVAAIALLAVGAVILFRKWEPFRNFVLGLVGFLQNLGAQIRNAFDVILSGEDVANGLAEILDNIFGNTGRFIEPLQRIIGGVIGVVDTVREEFDGLSQFVRDNWAQISQAIDNAVTIIRGILIGITRFLVNAWEVAGDDILRVVDATFRFIGDIIRAAGRVIEGIIKVIVGILTLDFGLAWQGVVDIVGGAWEAILAFVRLGWAQLKAVLAIVAEGIVTLLSEPWRIVASLVDKAWEGLKGLARDGVRELLRVLEGLGRDIGRIASGLFSALKDAGLGVINDIVFAFTGLPGTLLGLITKISGAAKDIGKSILRGIGDGLRGGLGVVGNIVGDITSGLKNAVNRVIRGLERIINQGLDAADSAAGPFINFGSISLPRLHGGGRVPGSLGEEVLTVLTAGEEVTSQADVRRGGATDKLADEINITAPDPLSAARELDWLRQTRGFRSA